MTPSITLPACVVVAAVLPERDPMDRGHGRCADGQRHRHRRGGYETAQLLWLGREAETRDMCTAILRAQSVLAPDASVVEAATNALVVLDLAAGHYAAALEVLHRRHGSNPSADVEPATLPDMVEAGIRGGDRSFASSALRHLDAHVRMGPTPWGRGVLARSRALDADGDPELLYLEAISHLGDACVVADLARAHLLFGEWLRRQKRRAAARSHLRRAHDLFVEIGAGWFADRAAAELRATGERPRKRTMDTQHALTPQELHIATLAAERATNREIAQRLFLSARTVEYHLHNIFQKLQISSRRQLSSALAHGADGAGRRRLDLGAAG